MSIQRNSPPSHVASLDLTLPKRGKFAPREGDPRMIDAALGARASRSGSRSRPASVDSIREDLTDIPQSFLDQSLKAWKSPHGEHHDSLHPDSFTPNFYYPSNAFHGWAKVELPRKGLSKSSSDLTSMIGVRNEWLWDSHEGKNVSGVDRQAPTVRRVSIEDMPFEIIDMILHHLMEDISPDSYGPRNTDLLSCLMASRTLHAATLSVLYKHITIPFSNTFSKMLNHIGEYPVLGTLVRRLDFSHYTSVGFGRTRRDSWEIQHVTPRTILRCLELFTNLKEFQVHEHIDDELDDQVLTKLFSMSSIRALDFCACSSRKFVSGFAATITANPTFPLILPNLKRLGLHACTTLQAPVFEALLRRMTNLTHLDVGKTLITDEALLSIPPSARITHLNLGKCTRLTGPKVVEFLTTSEAVRDTLVVLNLLADRSRYLLLSERDLSQLLPRLPPTTRSLNIGGAQLSSKHVPLLLPLTKHLEELGLSNADLSVSDLNSFFVPRAPSSDDEGDISEEELGWEPCSLRYLDLTAVPPIKQATLFGSSCVLVSPHSYPLEVIELDDPVVQQLKGKANTARRLGWVVKELGRRGWFVRLPSVDNVDDGRRSWKMGARWWGMRKIPVAVQEVGGMYGHYMFKN